jgi:hypothetical protein
VNQEFNHFPEGNHPRGFEKRDFFYVILCFWWTSSNNQWTRHHNYSTWTAFVQLTLLNFGHMKNIKNSLLWHLLQPGLPPSTFPPEALLYWTARPRNPVLACNDDLANMFIEAMVTGEAVEFVYSGGSGPGRTRSVKVSLVFQRNPEGRVYVSGYCPERAANRVFALDLIMVGHIWN